MTKLIPHARVLRNVMRTVNRDEQDMIAAISDMRRGDIRRCAVDLELMGLIEIEVHPYNGNRRYKLTREMKKPKKREMYFSIPRLNKFVSRRIEKLERAPMTA